MKRLFQVSSDSPWRIRDFRIAAVARAVSFLGDEVALVALLLRVHDTGAGPSGVAALLLVAAVPTVVLAPWAGRVADRHDSRTVLVAAGTAQAIVCVALAWATWLPVVLALVVALQAVQAVALPAWGALVPTLVGDERAPRAIGDMQSLSLLAGVAGPAVAGLMVAGLGPAVPLLLDGATFAVLAGAALVISARRGGPSTTQTAAPRALDGLRVIRADAFVGPLLLGLLAFVVVGEVTNVVEVFLVRDALDAGPAAFGLLGAVFAVGAAAGAVLAGRVGDDGRRARLVAACATVLAVVLVVGGVVPTVVLFGVLWLVAGVANGALNVSVSTLVVLRTPETMRGQVIALLSGASRGAALLATVLGGWLGVVLGPRAVFVLSGVAALGVSLVLVLVVRRALPAVPGAQCSDDPVVALAVES